jgi:hypothetical protein
VADIGTWTRKFRAHVVEVGPALFLYEVFNFAYDRIFYPFAIAHWGYVAGSVIGLLGSIICCSALYWSYDKMRLDWLKAHAARELENKENKNRLEKAIVWVGSEKRSWKQKMLGVLLFLGATSVIDPLIIAIYCKRVHFKGIDTRDWAMLFVSIACANAWWILTITPFVMGFKLVTQGHL